MKKRWEKKKRENVEKEKRKEKRKEKGERVRERERKQNEQSPVTCQTRCFLIKKENVGNEKYYLEII